jgi:hypothetical protein
MKAILYAGVVLMTGASIYGFVNYRQTSHQKAFKNMYKEESPAEKTTEILPVSKTTNGVSKITGEEKMEAVNNTTEIPVRSSRSRRSNKFSTKLFSRSALRPVREVVVDTMEIKK